MALSLLERDLELIDASVSLHVVATGRDDGDVHPVHTSPATLVERQVAATGRPWSMLDQIHGTTVVDLERVDGVGGTKRRGPTSGVGDVAHTDSPDHLVAIWAADCAAVVLLSASGRLVVAHAGWRGLSAGVIEVALEAAGRGRIVAAALGPVIHPCCYEFGDADRRAVERGVRAPAGSLAASTSDGRPALDVPGAVATALARRNVRLDVVGPCTGCDDAWFSHRVRADEGRHATVAWLSPVSSRLTSDVGGQR